ncbi:MAG: thioesterase family protein [Porticoccaceae bacterium]|nr:thioesterase family protein [Porticoccaceae bacterium]
MASTSNSQLPFSEIVKVRYSDLDAQGHLYFANYLVFGDEVLGAYMEQLGLSIMDPLNAPCLIFTVNIHCDYLNEIAGDSAIAVYAGYGRLGKCSADAVFELYDNSDGVLLAKGGLTQVFVDPKTRQSMPIPAFYRENIIAQQKELES